jgi:single-strand DNA-binding protein
MYGLKNRVQLLGNMGAAAEIRKTAGDKKVANFSLATSEVRKNENGERTTETQWHRLVAWGKLADIIEEYTTKGSELMVEGKLIYRSYVSKEGETKYITEIEVREIMMMGNAQKSA